MSRKKRCNMGDVALMKPQMARRDVIAARMKREVAAKVGEVLRKLAVEGDGNGPLAIDELVVKVKEAIRPWVGKVAAMGVELGWMEGEEWDMQLKPEEVGDADYAMGKMGWHWHGEKKEKVDDGTQASDDGSKETAEGTAAGTVVGAVYREMEATAVGREGGGVQAGDEAEAEV